MNEKWRDKTKGGHLVLNIEHCDDVDYPIKGKLQVGKFIQNHSWNRNGKHLFNHTESEYDLLPINEESH